MQDGMPAKIALFFPDLSGGGAERVMLILAEGFAQRGLGVDMVLVRAKGDYLSQVSPSIRVIDLHARNAYAALPGLVGYLRREKPKALLSTLDLTNLIAILSGQIARTSARVVIRIANTVSIQQRSPLKKRLERLALTWIYPKADGIVAVSQGVAHDLTVYTGIPAGRIETIYNPVITPGLMQQTGQPVYSPWLAESDCPVVLGVGRLSSQKDFVTLIRAFARVHERQPARLMILGEGEQRPQLENIVQELGLQKDVDLPGFVKNPYYYMGKAAVFVLSSLWEGLPNSLIEALACGCPVVSTDCPSGPREILDGGKYGHLVPVGDAEAMAQAIESVLNGDARKPPADWLRQFELEHVVEQYMNVLGLESLPGEG
jgi:glycosyltransferase involved in cell wall biosynthesis